VADRGEDVVQDHASRHMVVHVARCHERDVHRARKLLKLREP